MTTSLERITTDSDLYRRHNSIHVGISHCKHPIGWIWSEYLKEMLQDPNYSIKSITVVSKCGVPITREELPPLETCSSTSYTKLAMPLQVSALSLPNVGRCDKEEEEGIGELQHEILLNNADYMGCNLDNSKKNSEDDRHRSNRRRVVYERQRQQIPRIGRRRGTAHGHVRKNVFNE